MLKKYFCICMVLTSVYIVEAQQYINGFNELEFGTTEEQFLSEYEGFRKGSTARNLENIGVVVYIRTINAMAGQAIWVSFYEGRFYRADVWYGNQNNNSIDSIFRDIVSTYGRRIDVANEGNTYSEYWWYLNNNFHIKASISLSNRQRSFQIAYIDPNVERRINELVNN